MNLKLLFIFKLTKKETFLVNDIHRKSFYQILIIKTRI